MPGGSPYSYSSNSTPSGVNKSKYGGPSYTGKKVESSDGGKGVGRAKPYRTGGGGGSGGATHSSYPTAQTGKSQAASSKMQKQHKGSKMAKKESRHMGGSDSYSKG